MSNFCLVANAAKNLLIYTVFINYKSQTPTMVVKSSYIWVVPKMHNKYESKNEMQKKD